MDTENEASAELANSFGGKLFYLYGYPVTPSCELGTLAIDKPDAHSEELRRQFQARHRLAAVLEEVGARVTTQPSEGAAANMVVLPDGCSAEHQASALAVGPPVISESALLQRIQSLQIAAAGNRHLLPADSASRRLRNSVSLDEMRVHEQGSDQHKPDAAKDGTLAAVSGGRGRTLSTGSVQRHHTVHRAPVPSTAAAVRTQLADANLEYTARKAPNRTSELTSDGPYGPASSDSDEPDNDPYELFDDERRERTEWHQMLTSALCSQVVDGEKKRLNAQADSHLFNLTDNEYAERLSELLQGHEDRSLYKHAHMELWLGCRAAIRGRTPLQEKQTLDSLRSLHVDTTLQAVIDFNAEAVAATTVGTDESSLPAEFSAQCLVQLQRLLRRVDYVEYMYPTMRALGEAKPLYASDLFQGKLSAITSWTNITVRIELLHKMIQRWTGSRELNLFATDNPAKYSSTTHGITGETPSITVNAEGISDMASPLSPTSASTRSALDAVKKRVQHTPFVERLLKENGMKKIFEQKILTELEHAMMAARRDMIENADMICEMGLPVTNRHMQELLLFPPRLLQTCLHIRLQSAENLVNPPLAQVDQLIEDIRDSLSVACRIKRTFISLVARVGKWNPEIRLDPEYDVALRSCLHTYFRLVHRKLVITKGTGTGAGTRDFEILESQWPFLLEIVRDIDGGHFELVIRYCQQVRRSMRLWTGILAQKLEGPEGYDSVDSRNLGKWISKALQDVRTPILKAQRLVRTIQEALINSTDYSFDDPFPVLAQLVDSKHVLIYTAGEWESHGVYIIGSQSLLEKPHLARELLSACIIDDVMNSERYRNCYLLVIRTDAEFNWTGPSVMPEGEQIPYQNMELGLGQMRLIAPGMGRLDRYRQWLERLNIAAERQPWQTYTAVTDEIVHNFISSRGKRRTAASRQKVNAASNSGNHDRRYAARYSGSEGTASNAGRSTTSSWNEDDLDSYNDIASEFGALRPSLEPSDRRLGRINSPDWNPEARSGLIEDMAKRRTRAKGKLPAPAQICELNRAHNPQVQREWTLLKYSITRMLDALTQIPDMLRTLHLDYHERGFYEARNRQRRGSDAASSKANDVLARGHGDIVCQGANCDLLEQIQEAFLFVSNTSSRGSRFLDLKAERYVRLALLHMCVGWCAFIAEDCMANERRTFRWAMQALEFTMAAGKNNTLQVLGREDWQLMKAQVAGCVTLMISHFDVLGDRNGDLNVKGRQKRREQEIARMDEPNMLLSLDGIGANFRTHLMQRQRVEHSQRVDMLRDEFLGEDCRIGRVLEVTARPEDQTLRLLAASSSNITMRWQIGRYIGGGAFGSVYVGYNLDTGELMAVKEIRFPTRPMERTAGNRGDGQRNDSGNKIVREMEVMSMLQHPNIVSYYGIEVHREKVYLFMELCKSNLAQVVKDQGRLDERTTRVFVVQMLRGLQYLHESGICHRDIKCDNTLLDEYMTIKLVDFGAAKVLNQQSLAATRRTRRGKDGASLTGTPMYMAPEVILGSNGGSMGVAAGGRGGGSASVAGEVLRPGKLGAQDIWSLGCCIVEMVTGNPPWAHLDNEWAIMYHVVSGDPPLPGTADISSEGMRFIRRCFTRQPADRPSAADLLEDEWLAGTLRSMERLEARNQSASKMAATPIDYMSSIGHIGGDLDSEPGARSAHNSHRSELGASIGTSIGLDLGVGRRSASRMRSVSSISSAMPSPTRSRKSSMHTKNLSGDLRFMSSTASLSNAEVLLSMMDPSHNSGGVSGGRLRAYSGSDRSGSIAAASGNAEQRSLNRTPGSPSSANSLHAAWPFNKSGSPRSTPGVVSSPADGLPVSALAGAGLDISAVTAPPFNPLSISDSESLAVLNSASIGSLASRGSPEMLTATEEELVAKYTSTAVIYQALSSSATSPMRSHRSASTHTPGIPSSRLHHTSDMGSPADSTGSVDSIESTNVSQFAVDTVSDTGIPSAVPADLGDEDEATRSKSLPANNAQPTSYLTTDDIQELTETTRRAVSALLTIPLEGADVAGVSGWLGEGNTPMELLNADEIKETVVATSQNIVRQREQQLRQKQEMRSVLQRRQFKNMMSRKAADDVAAELSPLTTSGAQLLSAVGPQSAPIIDGFQRSGSGASDMLDSIPRTAAPAFAAQMTEPLALYPLPPDEDDSP